LDESVGHLLDNVGLICDVVGDDEVDSTSWLASLELEVDCVELLAFLLLDFSGLLLLVAHDKPVELVLLEFIDVGHVHFDCNAYRLVPAL